MVGIFQMFKVGLNPPHHPVGNLLFLGPTGTGKTRVVEAAAEVLFGDENALIKIDCGEFQHSHEIAKLLGSPPGYLGHRETHPIFTQESVNRYHTEKHKFTFILFDEIEKASDALWSLLLGILDKAIVTTGDNSRIDLSCCIIVMTANVGAAEMSAMTKAGIGFVTKKATVDLDSKIQRTAIAAAKRKFSPEFMNRIDKTVVFKTLKPEHITLILDLELEAVQRRLLQTVSGNKFIFQCDPDVKTQILEEGTSAEYGARFLKRVIERKLVLPLSSLLDTGQIESCDLIRVSLNEDKYDDFRFSVEEDNSTVPMLLVKLQNSMPVKPILPPPPPVVREEPLPVRQARKRLKDVEDELAKAKELRKRLDRGYED
jgi:ATP-dependent Clp protease ATP-binding subunit ClpA